MDSERAGVGKAIAEWWGDILIFVGLAGLGVGLWMKSPWLSLTVCGVLVFWLGIRASIAQVKTRKRNR